MEKAITVKEFQKLAEKYPEETAKDLELMHQTVAKKTNLTEFRYFLNVAKAHDLNPFKKEIWCYKDNKDNLIIFTGRDGFLKKAQESNQFAGMRSCEVRKNDKFHIDVANGTVEHNITTLDDEERGEITGAYAIVYRHEGQPTIEIVSWKTYNKANNSYTPWKTHPAEMIKKVAESHALKKAFGISQLQTEEDFNIRGDQALPLGTEVANLNIQDGEVIETVSEVYKAMLKKIENVKSERDYESLKKEITNQEKTKLLTPEAVEELRVSLENKFSEKNNGRDN